MNDEDDGDKDEEVRFGFSFKIRSLRPSFQLGFRIISTTRNLLKCLHDKIKNHKKFTEKFLPNKNLMIIILANQNYIAGEC